MEASVGQNTTKDIPANEQIQVPPRRSFSLTSILPDNHAELRNVSSLTRTKPSNQILPQEKHVNCNNFGT